MGNTRGGSRRNCSLDISSAASRTACSVVGSSVMTNGRSFLSSCGNCSTASMPMCFAARMPDSAEMMPGGKRRLPQLRCLYRKDVAVNCAGNCRTIEAW